jgi:hypothetical protein
MQERLAHWQRVYTTKQSDQVSWFEREPTHSLRLMEEAGLAPST